VHTLSMGVGVHTALLAITQLSSVTEGFNCVGELVKKLALKPSFYKIQPPSVQLTFSLMLKATLINSQLPTCPVLFFFIFISYRSSFLPNMYSVSYILKYNFYTS